MRTTDEELLQQLLGFVYKKAPLGTAVMQVCAACYAEMPGILIKKKGPSPDKVKYVGPYKLAFEGEYCEFCQFVGMYKASEGYDGKMAAGKIVKGEERELVAFVPFLADEETREITVGDEQVPRAHGLVILAEMDEEGTGAILVKVLERGIPCDEPEEDGHEGGNVLPIPQGEGSR